jgi:hypothetical protein
MMAHKAARKTNGEHGATMPRFAGQGNLQSILIQGLRVGKNSLAPEAMKALYGPSVQGERKWQTVWIGAN